MRRPRGVAWISPAHRRRRTRHFLEALSGLRPDDPFIDSNRRAQAAVSTVPYTRAHQNSASGSVGEDSRQDLTQLLSVFQNMRGDLTRVIARRLDNRETAADIVQELYFRLQRVDERFASNDDARRYLMRMAINASTDHLRVEGRRTELLEGVVELFDRPEPTPEEIAISRERVQHLGAAMAQLPERDREILYMSRVQGLTHAEISEALGVSRSLIEKSIIRSVAYCRVHVEQGGPS